MEEKIILTFEHNQEQAQLLSKAINAEIGKMTMRRFPDGETYVRLETDVKDKTAIIVCTLHEPDLKFLPLYFLSQTAKELGAKKVCLVAPYLAYMRQDKRFHEGEAVSSKHFAKLLSHTVDSLITVDPHLHRRSSLNEIYSIPTKIVHAAPHISKWIKEKLPDSVLIGPDSESEQWVSEVAKDAGVPFIVLQKIRHGDRDVEVSVPEVEKYLARIPVLVDDIISTAKTMIQTVGHIRNTRMQPPLCIGVHAIFAEKAFSELKAAGASKIITCNTISHESNEIDLTESLSSSIKALI